MGGLLTGETGATTLLHFVSQLPHGILSDGATIGTRDGSLRGIHGSQDFRTATLSLFPQGQSLLYRFFLAVKASTFNGQKMGYSARFPGVWDSGNWYRSRPWSFS